MPTSDISSAIVIVGCVILAIIATVSIVYAVRHITDYED